MIYPNYGAEIRSYCEHDVLFTLACYRRQQIAFFNIRRPNPRRRRKLREQRKRNAEKRVVMIQIVGRTVRP